MNQPEQSSIGARPTPDRVDQANLVKAVARGDVAELRRLIAMGVSTPTEQLQNAAARGHAALVQALLADGADVHHRDDAALQRGGNHPECLGLLLRAGANVHAQDDGARWEVVRLAYSEGRQRVPRQGLLDCARQLVAAGANPLARHPLAEGDSILEHNSRPVSKWTHRTGRYPEFPIWAGAFVEILVNSLPPLSLIDQKRVQRVCEFLQSPQRHFRIRLTEEAIQRQDRQNQANKKRAATRGQTAAAKTKTEMAHATAALQHVPLPPGYSIETTENGLVVRGAYLAGAVRELRALNGTWDQGSKEWTVALAKVDKLIEALERFSA